MKGTKLEEQLQNFDENFRKLQNETFLSFLKNNSKHCIL